MREMLLALFILDKKPRGQIFEAESCSLLESNRNILSVQLLNLQFYDFIDQFSFIPGSGSQQL